MIPKVGRGDRMFGCVKYLVGPGRSNEHVEPRIVAGDAGLMLRYQGRVLTEDDVRGVSDYLDVPHAGFGIEVNGGHVWHCPLSLSADEGVKTDEQWRAIAEDFVRRMEFDDCEGTKAPCRWVAIRHGVSAGGNDHVHLVVDLVREDATKASTFHDYARAQQACRAIEETHGLVPLESVGMGRSTIGWERGEKEHAQRVREALTGRERLAVQVRAAAVASADEGEFVRRLRAQGVLVRPRYEQGGTGVVEGFSVALRPSRGQRAVWFGGGRLAHDLTLPRLRELWTGEDSRAAGLAEWAAAAERRRPVGSGAIGGCDVRQVRRVNAQLEQLEDELRAVPTSDRATWCRVARHTSGVLGRLAQQIPEQRAGLERAAEMLSRSAQTWRPESGPSRVDLMGLRGAGSLVGLAARGHNSRTVWAITLRNMMRLSAAVTVMLQAEQQARLAQATLVAVRQEVRQAAVWAEQQAGLLEPGAWREVTQPARMETPAEGRGVAEETPAERAQRLANIASRPGGTAHPLGPAGRPPARGGPSSSRPRDAGRGL